MDFKISDYLSHHIVVITDNGIAHKMNPTAKKSNFVDVSFAHHLEHLYKTYKKLRRNVTYMILFCKSKCPPRSVQQALTVEEVVYIYVQHSLTNVFYKTQKEEYT